MKKNRLVLILLFCALIVSCNNKEFLLRMQENEEGVHNPTTVAELEDAISKYKKRVDDIMLAENRIAIWYKMLGTRYIDQKMYIKALDAFTQALTYYPENHNLYYEIGLCASNIAKNNASFLLGDTEKQRQDYYKMAKTAYMRALELQPAYTKAAYSLAVMYVFELNEGEKAISVLLPVIEREPKNYDALFVLASAYYISGQPNEAIKIYTDIIDTAKDKNIIESAQKNMAIIETEKK